MILLFSIILFIYTLFVIPFLVPPLKGFVMNRVTGDYFETLLYKIFVSIDEHTTMTEVCTTFPSMFIMTCFTVAGQCPTS